MAIAKLSIDLEARLANLQAGLDKAGFLAQQSADRMNGAFKSLQGTLKGVFAGLGARELVQFFNATVDGVDKLNDLADATGASVENLSALEDIAVRTGTSVDTMGDAIVKMNKALADAKPGSDQAAAFEALGLSIKDLKALDPVEAFQKIAIALQGFADDGNKARLVQELFGKSLRDVAPLLKDAAEAGKLVATVTREQALEAERFNKELYSMQKNIVDAARALTGPMISALNETIDKFREGAKEGKSFYRVIFEEQLKLLGLKSEDKGPKVIDLTAGIGGREFNRPLLSLPDIGGGTKGSKGGGSAKNAAAKDAAERLRLAEFSARQLLDLEEETARDTAEAWEFYRKAQDKSTKESAAAAKEQWRQFFEFYDQQQEEADQQVRDTVLGTGKAALDEWSVFADEAARNIQDALGDTLQATMEGNWRNIGDLWKRTLDRMVAEALAAKLGQALLGDFGKSGNVGGLAGDAIGFLSQLFKPSASGNAFGPGGVLAFANGGVVNGATPFAFGGGRLGVMGEAGPEAVMPLKRGRDGKLGVGGGIVVNQTIHVSTSGPGDRRSMAQLQAEIGIATQRAIARNT